MIVDVTDRAREELTKLLEQKKTEKPLKIFIAAFG